MMHQLAMDPVCLLAMVASFAAKAVLLADTPMK
jgi:hypothetical protein